MKIKPVISVPRPPKSLKLLQKTPKIDLSGEEKGYFKIGDRIVNILFPR